MPGVFFKTSSKYLVFLLVLSKSQKETKEEKFLQMTKSENDRVKENYNLADNNSSDNYRRERQVNLNFSE